MIVHTLKIHNKAQLDTFRKLPIMDIVKISID